MFSEKFYLNFKLFLSLIKCTDFSLIEITLILPKKLVRNTKFFRFKIEIVDLDLIVKICISYKSFRLKKKKILFLFINKNCVENHF